MGDYVEKRILVVVKTYRPIELSDEVDVDELTESVVEVWTAILETIEEELSPERRGSSVIPAPSIMAGLGVVAHHAMPDSIRNESVEQWTVDQVLELLEDVTWDREQFESLPVEDQPGGADAIGFLAGKVLHPWVGIAGKVTPSGGFSIGGPKEVGYQVAEALQDSASTGGKQIRPKAS